METLVRLFWMFIKINILTTSGPASVGLLHQEAVGVLMSEAQFIQAVGFSSLLPGSDALQLAMFVGYSVAGTAGAMVALLGSILPPTLLMLGVVSLLHRLRREAWVSSFVDGLAPSVAVLMGFVAWKLMAGSSPGGPGLETIIIAVSSLAALALKVPAPLVLLFSGLAGVVVFR